MNDNNTQEVFEDGGVTRPNSWDQFSQMIAAAMLHTPEHERIGLRMANLSDLPASVVDVVLVHATNEEGTVGFYPCAILISEEMLAHLEPVPNSKSVFPTYTQPEHYLNPVPDTEDDHDHEDDQGGK